MPQSEIRRMIENLSDCDFDEKKVLISGGAGFIGSWISEALLELNAEVICVDNFASGRKENIFHLLKNDHFSLIQEDIITFTDPGEQVDFILHLASRASPFEFDKFPLEILKSNTLGTINLLEIARKHQAKFLFTSTSEIYGDSEVFPTPETYHGNVNSIGVRGCYDEAKRAGEALCMAYLRQYNLDVRIARIFNTYGPRMRHDGFYGRVVPRFLQQALNNEPITIFGDGSQTRSFCYITDQVNGLLKLISRDNLKGEVINIGNPKELTIVDLAKLVLSITNSKSVLDFFPLPPDDPKRRFPDIHKAISLLDWQPKINLEDGLMRMINMDK
jgi:UDP-glucuronate decarboxylase